MTKKRRATNIYSHAEGMAPRALSGAAVNRRH